MAYLAFSIAALKQAFEDAFSWEKPAEETYVLSQYLDFYQLTFQDLGQHYAGFVPAAGYQIALQAWVPPVPKGTLFVVHGYFDHVGLYRHLIAWALKRELTVVAFDLPGHGLSSGVPASIPDFMIYQQVLSEVIGIGELGLAAGCAPKPWSAVGQSTGAAILLDSLLGASAADTLAASTPSSAAANAAGPEQDVVEEDPPLVAHQVISPPWRQVALLAPLVRVTSWGSVNITWQLLHRFQDKVPRSFGVNSHDKAFLNFQKFEDPLQERYVSADWVGAMIRWVRRIESAKPCEYSPVILQGDEDKTVDYAFNLPLLSAKFAKPKIIMLPNGRHHLVNESEKLRAEMLRELESVFFSSELSSQYSAS
jgi:alpha-beta hydrolase superfamily lysophospholipase